MSSSQPKTRFNDIIFNIDRIASYLEGYSYEDFGEDMRTVDAVERCMQRITEAAIKLQPLANELLPDQDWDDMRSFGNVLRHNYDEISAKTIWDIAQDFLPRLREDCKRAVTMIKDDRAI